MPWAIHYSIIYSSKKLEATQILINYGNHTIQLQVTARRNEDGGFILSVSDLQHALLRAKSKGK